MQPLVTGLPVGPGSLVLGLILPVVVDPGVSLSCEHCRDHEEEERFVGDCSAGLPRLFLCILDHINIIGYPPYFEVILLHFIMQRQEVEGMATCAPHLEVDEKRLWCNIGVKRLRVSEFPHPHILDDGKDELCSLLPCHLVGAAVGALGFVRHFRARADDSLGIVIDCCIVGDNLCGFGELRSIARCVLCHRRNEADKVVCASCFVVWDLKEERHHNLPDSCEIGV